MIPFPIVKTLEGEELVIVPRADYERLATLAAEAEEDADDISAYDAAMVELGDKPEWTSPELSALLLEHKTRLGAIRRWKGLSLDALAEDAGLSPKELGELETGELIADANTIARLALALSVPIDWLS